ncbi:MAG TPA: hypothetical protein VGC42_10045 [Kofleriaceae bacterium]
MVDLEPGRAAVELPAAWFAPGPRRRRHRGVTGMAGMLLFACMFLPAIQSCNQPMTPLEAPAFLPPYIYGLVFAVIALIRGRRRVDVGIALLRVMAGVLAAGALALFAIEPCIGVVALFCSGGLLAIVWRPRESRIVATGLAISVASMAWFGFWVATPDALIGVQLSLASAAGLFIGCVAWLRELIYRPAIELPHAHLRAR